MQVCSDILRMFRFKCSGLCFQAIWKFFSPFCRTFPEGEGFLWKGYVLNDEQIPMCFYSLTFDRLPLLPAVLVGNCSSALQSCTLYSGYSV